MLLHAFYSNPNIIINVIMRKVICNMQIYIDHARLITYRLSNDDNCNSNFLIISVKDILIYSIFIIIIIIIKSKLILTYLFVQLAI